MFKIALSAGVFLLPVSAYAQDVQPSQLFTGKYLILHAPSAPGWQIINQSKSGMTFGRGGSEANETYAAQVTLFELPESKDQAQFLELIRQNLEADAPPDRFKAVETKYEYNDQRGYPCVSYAATSEDTKAKTGLFSRTSLKLQINALYCRHPTLPTLGFMIGYSHRGTHADPTLEQQAKAFIDGVTVPPP